MEKIRRHNSIESKYKLGENQFADKTFQFLKKTLLQNHFTNNHTTNLFRGPSTDIPQSFDWTGHVSRVKNQGRCGSCWAFSTIGAMESLISIRYGKQICLSEQNLVDCDIVNHGCRGGLMHLAFDHIQSSGGIAAEEDYPYTGLSDDCSIVNLVRETKDVRYTFVPPHRPDLMMTSIQKNPLCAAVAADSFEFMFYKDGIFDQEETNKHLSHAILITGYNRYHDPYWILKNSWDTTWGQDGYMHLRLKNDCDRGVVGINEYVLFPHY
jgi:KDEL-tailed cysteine endopeptidase